jgi:hypothetical protein
MSLTASIQHLKLRSMPQNSVTAWREQKTSVTSEQIDMAAGFQRIWAKPDIRHRADAAFGTCDVFETHVSRRTSDAQNRWPDRKPKSIGNRYKGFRTTDDLIDLTQNAMIQYGTFLL